MTLPVSPPITLAQVRAEFGAPAGTPLHAFVRGGAWVPNTPQNSSVPTAAPIRLAQLCGASKSAPLTVSLSTTAVSGARASAGSVLVTSDSVTANASGGTGSYTYSWEFVSGTAMNMSNPTGATTNFSLTLGPAQGVKTASYRCKVTSGGVSVYTGNVNVTLENAGTN